EAPARSGDLKLLARDAVKLLERAGGRTLEAAIAQPPDRGRERRAREGGRSESARPAGAPLAGRGQRPERRPAARREVVSDELRPGAREGLRLLGRRELGRVERDLVVAVEIDEHVELAAEGEQILDGEELLRLLPAPEREVAELQALVGELRDAPHLA